MSRAIRILMPDEFFVKLCIVPYGVNRNRERKGRGTHSTDSRHLRQYLVIGITAQIEALVAYRKSLIYERVTGQQRLTEEDLRRAGGTGRTCLVRQSS
jgi:hypothetical protein